MEAREVSRRSFRFGAWAVAAAGVAACALPMVAKAGDGRLLVIVEDATPGPRIESPAEVRRAIAEELSEPVLSPSDRHADGASRVLLVALGPQSIAMSLRASEGTRPLADVVTRALPAPHERDARLQRIAWLAGNLVRDQVTALVPAAPTVEAGPADERAPVTQPPPVPASSPAASPTGQDVTLSRSAATPPAPAVPIGWSVMAAGGMGGMVLPNQGLSDFQAYQFLRGAAWQVEVAHRASAGGTMLGGAIDAGPSERHTIGVAAFWGATWEHRRWSLEATGGIGLEALRTLVQTQSFSNSSTMGTTAVLESSTGTVPGLYARGTLGAGTPISSSLDVVARLTGHLSTEALSDDFLALTAGIRLRLP